MLRAATRSDNFASKANDPLFGTSFFNQPNQSTIDEILRLAVEVGIQPTQYGH